MLTTGDDSDQDLGHHEGKGNKFNLNGAKAERGRGGCGAVVCRLTE